MSWRRVSYVDDIIVYPIGSDECCTRNNLTTFSRELVVDVWLTNWTAYHVSRLAVGNYQGLLGSPIPQARNGLASVADSYRFDLAHIITFIWFPFPEELPLSVITDGLPFQTMS